MTFPRFVRFVLLLLLVALLAGCADVALWNYRRQGGFYDVSHDK